MLGRPDCPYSASAVSGKDPRSGENGEGAADRVPGSFCIPLDRGDVCFSICVMVRPFGTLPVPLAFLFLDIGPGCWVVC